MMGSVSCPPLSLSFWPYNASYIFPTKGKVTDLIKARNPRAFSSGAFTVLSRIQSGGASIKSLRTTDHFTRKPRPASTSTVSGSVAGCCMVHRPFYRTLWLAPPFAAGDVETAIPVGRDGVPQTRAEDEEFHCPI